MIWLMQDECKPLSRWLSTRLGDYREIKGCYVLRLGKNNE
jgi:hypothetical protein